MTNPHYWIGDEEVNGIIVGGDHHVGALYYDGRGPLGGKLRADDEAGLIYPDDGLWELRIYE